MANKLKNETVKYICELAKLELTPKERKLVKRDMNKVLKHIDKLNELDTTNYNMETM